MLVLETWLPWAIACLGQLASSLESAEHEHGSAEVEAKKEHMSQPTVEMYDFESTAACWPRTWRLGPAAEHVDLVDLGLT